VNRTEVYCEPASEWWTAPPRGRPCRARSAAACRIARSTNAVSFDSEHSHPGISPANAPTTNAVYPNPPPSSGTYVKSATCSWPGRSAWKSRLTRSGARLCPGSGIVVRTARPRVTPRHPLARISRSTAHRATVMPCRFRCSRIFRLPYRHSGGRRPFSSGS
jgi:hypothetical protein